MRNAPYNSMDIGSSHDDRAGSHVDQQPALRMKLLFVVMSLPVMLIAGRLGWLQVCHAQAYIVEWDQTFETLEPIVSQDGRILSADGTVLAHDVPRYDLLVHYRWLQEPIDERWLTQQAHRQLTRSERRHEELLEAAKQEVVAQRQELWERVSSLTGDSVETIDERRRLITARVQRIVELVEGRQKERREEANRPAESQLPNDESWGWRAVWNTVVSELTTPPRRGSLEPIVIREELDYHIIAENVDLRAVAAVESYPSQYPGMRTRIATDRAYPKGDLAAHLIGVRTPLSPEEASARQAQFPEGDPLDYREADRIGRGGIERTYDRRLRGLRGARRLVRNRQGEVIHTEVVRQPVDGRDVTLTFDSQLQHQAEAILDRVVPPIESLQNDESLKATPGGGCIVAIDVQTGDLLAAAAAPRFDLRLLVDYNAEAWQAVTQDPRQPFFPRITQMALPPGSVFKTLTAVALLEQPDFEPADTVFCKGYLDNPNKNRCYIFRHYGLGHGDMSLTDALCQSCNVYFFDQARKMGPEPIALWARRFGYGSSTGTGIPGEKSGNVPVPNAPPGPGGAQWYPGSTLQLAIGQSTLTVTPLQVARMMSAIANDGYLVTPRLVSRDSEYDSSIRTRIPGLSPDTLAAVREGMRQVVAHRKGTGKVVRMDVVSIAGKTGTAEAGGSKGDHAWFEGFAPADNPRVAFTVVVEHGGSGGRAAAPLAKELIESMLDLGFLHPTSQRELTRRDE